MSVLYGVCLATLLTYGAYGAVTPSGKCNTHHITPIPLDSKTPIVEWDFIYITDDGENVDKIDKLSAAITPNEDHTKKMVITTVLKDKSTSTQNYTLAVVDDVILQDTIVNGKPVHFHMYPLAKTNENAYLLYRCADISRSPVDTRFIVVPRGQIPSEKSLKQLLDADKKYNFKGDLTKL